MNQTRPDRRTGGVSGRGDHELAADWEWGTPSPGAVQPVNRHAKGLALEVARASVPSRTTSSLAGLSLRASSGMPGRRT
jgi:hypothetical protein